VRENPDARTQEDPERAVERILKHKPKYIEILGGEPLLVPNMPDLIARIKREADNPTVMISTNLCVPETLSFALLKEVEHLFVSIDGLGEHNTQTRGVDGDKLFARFQRLVSERNRRGSKTRLHTATCVHIHNFQHVPALLERIFDTDPSAEMVVIPIEPYDHPDSLTHSPQAMAAFLHTMEDLKGRLPVSMSRQFNAGLLQELRGHDASPTEASFTANHRCYRQFFRLVIDSKGREITCKPSRPIVHYSDQLQKARCLSHMLTIVRNMVSDLFLQPCSPMCRMPCCASEFLEDLIGATSVDDLPRELCMFENRFTAAQVAVVARSVRCKLNVQWPKEIEQRLVCYEDRKA